MSRANEPVYPVIETQAQVVGSDGDYTTYGDTYSTGGLTIREHFAGLAMQGVLSCEVAMSICDESAFALGITRAEWIASQAASMADALIAELERTK